MTLALVLGGVLAVLVVIAVARPFLREPAPESDALDEPGELERRRLTLAEERDQALAALKELEFDHRTGKVSDNDYRVLVGPLRRAARRYVRWNRGQKPVMPASPDRTDQTRRVQLPPDETGPVPVSLARAEPRWFGVPPPLLLLGLAVFSFALSVALFAGGSWPAGLILLGLAALFAAAFLEIARRRPETTFTRASSDVALGARSWASSRLELLVARSSAVADAQRLRGNQAVIEAERRAALLRLGEAVQSEDEAAAAARERLAELDRADDVLHGRLAARLARSDERVRRVRMSIQQTVIVPPSDDDSHRPAA